MDIPDIIQCAICERKFAKNPSKPQMKYCGSRCRARSSALARQARLRNGEGCRTIACARCGEDFLQATPHQKYDAKCRELQRKEREAKKYRKEQQYNEVNHRHTELEQSFWGLVRPTGKVKLRKCLRCRQEFKTTPSLRLCASCRECATNQSAMGAQ